MRYATAERQNYRDRDALKGLKMTIDQARAIAGSYARWELAAIKKALSMHQWLNTVEEKQRLEAVKILLRVKK